MKLLLLALLVSLAAVVPATGPASACTDPSVCSVLRDARCVLADPTDLHRVLSACLRLIP